MPGNSPRSGPHPLPDTVVRSALLAAVCYGAGKLGLEVALLHESATPVWPPTGISIAALLLFGRRLWPGVFAGAFLVNLATADAAAVSFGMALGNTLEAVLGSWLVERYASGTRAFDRARDVLRFVVLAGMLAPAVSASIGLTSLALGGLADWKRFGPIWLTWWLGDLVSALVLAPLLVVWGRGSASARGSLEMVLMVAVIAATAAMVFGGLLPAPFDRYPTSFLAFPPLLWPVFRLGQRGTVLAILVLAGVALAGTLVGLGPFASPYLGDSLVVLQAFVATVTVTNLVLAALVGERRKAERGFERSQETLQAQLIEIEDLYRTAPVGLCLLDRDLTFVRINARLADINGVAPADHLGRTVRDVVPDLADRAESSMRQVLASGEPILDIELAGTTAAQPGVVRHWLESYHPLRDGDGAVIGLNAVVQEVTSMKRAEEAVRRSERELAELFENASQGIEWVAADGTILRSNRAQLRMLGYPADEYLGRHLSEFHASPEVAGELLRRLASAERLEEFPARLRTKSGALRDVVIDSSTCRQDDGGPPRPQLFIRDVTERRAAEEELSAWQRELERRVEHRTADLALAQRRLEAEAEARKRLEAEVAAAVESEQLRLGQELHEGLGQELTGIAYLMAALQRALSGSSSAQAREALRLEQMITRSIERTRSLAKAFYPVEMETLGLLASLEEIADGARSSFGVDCVVSIAEDSVCAELRGPLAIQFFRIAQEAVLHAVERRRARCVEITATVEGGNLVMIVADDGAGLLLDLDEVAGAELRIMRYRAGIVGGSLEVRSQHGGGTLLVCSAPLPLAQGRAETS